MRLRPLLLVPCSVLGALVVSAAHPSIPLPADRPPGEDKTLVATAADVEWDALLTARAAAYGAANKSANAVGADAAAAQSARLAQAKALADQARAFYTKHADYYWAPEAKRLEIVALVEMEAEGDRTLASRLEKAVAALRADAAAPAAIRAAGAGAYEFSRAISGLREPAARLAAVEKAARALVKEFPAESPGYQVLLAVADASGPDQAKALGAEVARAPLAPAAQRQAAQALALRLDLLGKPLAKVWPGSAMESLVKLRPGEPVLLYTWSSAAMGSQELGQMVQARRINALAVCLEADVKNAQATQRRLGLGGEQVFDAQGAAGAVAAALALTLPGQIYLVDAAGVIRDVRGGENFETKLKDLGFKFPALQRPATQL